MRRLKLSDNDTCSPHQLNHLFEHIYHSTLIFACLEHEKVYANYFAGEDFAVDFSIHGMGLLSSIIKSDTPN